MDSKGFIQLFNTKWSNTNLHYSKSAYSSYAIALVLCETWTNLSEHSRQLLQLTAKAIPEGPFQSTALTSSPLYLNQITAAQHKGSGVTVLLGHSPSWTLPNTAAVSSPAQPWPQGTGTGATQVPHHIPLAQPELQWLSPARQAPGSKGDVDSSEKSI